MIAAPELSERDRYMVKAQADPVWWMHRFLGEDLWQTQIEIAEALRDHPKVAVRSCHASGKTRLASSLVLWFAYSFPGSLTITTGPGDRQVGAELWNELSKAYYSAKVTLGGKLGKDKRLHVETSDGKWRSRAMGFATDRMERFHGFHADYMLIVVDEASAVQDDIFEAIEGARSAGQMVRLLLLSQMTRTSGAFFNAFNRDRESWKCFTIAADTTPNFAPPVVAAWEDAGCPREGFPWPRPYLINPGWAREMLDSWGEDSDLYRVRVLGVEPKHEATSVIPLHMVEAAIARTLAPSQDSQTWMGLDVARYGDDDSVAIIRRGPVVLSLGSVHGQDTVEVAEWALETATRAGVTDINVDEIGVGAGVVDALRRLCAARQIHVNGINAGANPRDTEHFQNRRAEDYMGLRERFEKGDIALSNLSREDLERLIPELTGLRWKPASPSGKMQLEAKDDFKKRLSRSPDSADALALAFCVPTDATWIDYMIAAPGDSHDPFFGFDDD